MAWKKLDPSRTLHRSDCARVFSRYDATCPRCKELMAGGQARKGWGSDRDRKAEEARTIAAIRAHDFDGCARRNGGVCTHFEW